jgi:hypothetical protein
MDERLDDRRSKRFTLAEERPVESPCRSAARRTARQARSERTHASASSIQLGPVLTVLNPADCCRRAESDLLRAQLQTQT